MNCICRGAMKNCAGSLIVTLSLVAALPALSQQPAFPGAEGGGMYTRGGRGGKVLEVTSLADDGSAGTLRYAVNQNGARTAVFRISGTIILNSRLVITKDSITIAGQTAPGDGICVRRYPLEVSANQVIIRYLRFRLGDESKEDHDAFDAYTNSLTGFKRNIIVDHCSASWSLDETLTSYGNDSLTVQWCIASESLYHSYHPKGNHGYGGIWGGRVRSTFHHNLLAHHSSRNPRLSGSTTTVPTYNVDLRNNVIYNWGFNSAYGGEGGTGNFVNNYYKPGPATMSNVRSRIFQPSDTLGRWYVDGNAVEGNPSVSADNWAGGVNPDIIPRNISSLKTVIPFPYMTVTTHTAQQAIDLVLDYAGASLPKRDTIDRRIVYETRTGTVTFGGHGDSSYPVMQKLDTSKVYGIINSQIDVGGWPVLNSLPAPADTDHDGMPDAWETANGLDPNSASDRNVIGTNGYTMLENYLNSLVGTNPGTTSVRKDPSIPAQFLLEQNFPNPFNPSTVISYQLLAPSARQTAGLPASAGSQGQAGGLAVEGSAVSLVKLSVYDVLGREVATLVNAEQSPGRYQVLFEAGNLKSGVYFYRLQARQVSGGQAGNFVETKKLVLVK